MGFHGVRKAYDTRRTDRDGLLTLLRLYWLGGILLEGVRSLYVNSRANALIGTSMSDWFPVEVGLCQGVCDVMLAGVVR